MLWHDERLALSTRPQSVSPNQLYPDHLTTTLSLLHTCITRYLIANATHQIDGRE